MPVLKCDDGKWRIGKGKCIYDSKEKAEKAYKGYLGAKYGKGVHALLEKIAILKPRVSAIIGDFLEKFADKEINN